MFESKVHARQIRSSLGLIMTILALSACAHGISKPPAEEMEPISSSDPVLSESPESTPEPLAAPINEAPVVKKHKVHKKHGRHHSVAKHRALKRSAPKATNTVAQAAAAPIAPPVVPMPEAQTQPPAPIVSGTVGGENGGLWEHWLAILSFAMVTLGIFALIWMWPRQQPVKAKAKAKSNRLMFNN